MIIVYKPEAFQELPKNGTISFPIPQSEEEIYKAVKVKTMVEQNSPVLVEFAEEFTHQPDFFIKKLIPVTPDLLDIGNNTDEDWEVAVHALTGQPRVYWRYFEIKTQLDGKMAMVPRASTPSIAASCKVSPIVLPLIGDGFDELVDEYVKELEERQKNRKNLKLRKGDRVIVRSWVDVSMDKQVHTAAVDGLTYIIDSDHRVYRGQVEWYQGKEAIVATAHKNGTFTLEWADKDLDENSMLIQGVPVKIAEPLKWTLDTLDLVAPKVKKEKKDAEV